MKRREISPLAWAAMHIRKLPSGRYRWIVQHQGHRRDGTADKRPAAVLAASRALIALGATGTSVDDLTVEDLLHTWVEEHPDWSPTYRADIKHVVGHLPPVFLARDVRTVTPPVVAALYRELGRAGWSAHRVGRVHTALTGAFKLAVTYGWLTANPTRELSPPKFDKPDVAPPSHDLVASILDRAPARLHLILRLAALTGCRLGELVALRWDDLDGPHLNVRRAVVWTPGDGLEVRDQTKSGRKGDRRLELDDDTLVLLAELRATQAAKAIEHLLPTPVYMFSHTAGADPWRPGYVGLEYRRLRKTIPGAESVRFHDLRHYVATTMLLDGENPMDVAAQLGHSTSATTLRVYAHYLPGRGGESTRKRAARLKRPSP